MDMNPIISLFMALEWRLCNWSGHGYIKIWHTKGTFIDKWKGVSRFEWKRPILALKYFIRNKFLQSSDNLIPMPDSICLKLHKVLCIAENIRPILKSCKHCWCCLGMAQCTCPALPWPALHGFSWPLWWDGMGRILPTQLHPEHVYIYL